MPSYTSSMPSWAEPRMSHRQREGSLAPTLFSLGPPHGFRQRPIRAKRPGGAPPIVSMYN